MNISVIGCGYVGLVTAAIAEIGHTVVDPNALRPVVVTAPAHEGIEDNPDNALINGPSYCCRLRIKDLGAQALEKSSKWTES
jgi:hypothetical protein